ncbi:MAG: RsmB/NOP family class I SAM-dependent RNA methyltransferase [Coxiellaceae bacterium]|nr:RsmB/NOP family class I SAM-dependent RNA methyltransferase [Coxiellaceae bacterium]
MFPPLSTIFYNRLSEIIPENRIAQVTNSFSAEKPVAFRVNTLKNTIDNVVFILQDHHFDLTNIPWNPLAFTIPFEQREQLTRHTLFLSGDIYIQSLASQIPALILNPQLDEEILDLTAAPGSKTTQIAALMQNTGRIAAVEMAKPRFFRLLANVKLQGATNVVTYLKDGTRVGKACPDRFDRVLLDAPCSSEGRFHLSNPDSFAYWSLNKIKAMSKKQWPLLQSAFHALKPGGILVYSTCTFAPEENEMMVQKLLHAFPDDLKIVPIDIALPEKNKMAGLTHCRDNTFDAALQNTLRVLPDETMDGFFVACLEKIKKGGSI